MPSNPFRRKAAFVGSSIRFEPAQAELIIDVLVAECGVPADLDSRIKLADFLTRDLPGVEYRFMGNLGAGGKLFNANGGKLWVSCYPENETPARIAAIGRANARINALLVGWGLARGL